MIRAYRYMYWAVRDLPPQPHCRVILPLLTTDNTVHIYVASLHVILVYGRRTHKISVHQLVAGPSPRGMFRAADAGELRPTWRY